MDTKRVNVGSSQSRAGKTKFGKISIAAGGIAVGAFAGIHLQPAHPHPSDKEQTETDTHAAEVAANNTVDNETTQENTANHAPAQNPEHNPNEPQPTEPHPTEPGQPTNPTGEHIQPSTEESEVNHVAMNVLQENQIDDNEQWGSGFMRVGEPTTIYTEDGNELSGYTVEIDGYTFALTDPDGDGIYNALYTPNGEAFDFALNVQTDNGVVQMPFSDFMAQEVKMTHSDLEEASNNTGGYIARNEHDQDEPHGDDPTGDIIDTHANENQNSLAQRNPQDDVDEDTDEDALEELLAQLLGEDEEDENDEHATGLIFEEDEVDSDDELLAENATEDGLDDDLNV